MLSHGGGSRLWFSVWRTGRKPQATNIIVVGQFPMHSDHRHLSLLTYTQGEVKLDGPNRSKDVPGRPALGEPPAQATDYYNHSINKLLSF